MVLKNRVVNSALVLGLALIVMVLVTACGGGGATATEETDVFLQPLPTGRPEMLIAGPGGAMPCGIAEAGWGYHTFRVGDFSGCGQLFPSVTVYCLTGEGQWSPANVSDIDISTDTETVAFEVQQDGICGLFPQ
jgi:hypothetical protein